MVVFASVLEALGSIAAAQVWQCTPVILALGR